VTDQRLPDLFLQATELDEAGREALLARVEREDPDLAGGLRLLLSRPESAVSSIDRPLPISEAHLAAPAPERVGPYRIVRELGRGGMGQVFLADHRTPDFARRVALKLIRRPSPDVVRRFREEVRILAGLEHPWIARFLDGGRSAEGIWYLALEYVEGEDIVAHVRAKTLDIDARVRLFASVVEAVAWAHERGVVHRDLKPGNVLVGRDGWPRLLDFGISKLLDPAGDADSTTTAPAARIFTPAYASPEQVAGYAAMPASDVYSLGVVLYELLAGRRPERGDDAAAQAEPVPPSTALRLASTRGSSGRRWRRGPAPRIRRALDAICLKALRVDPSERYASAAELLEDLHRYLDGESVEALAEGRVPPPVRTGRRLVLALAAALSLATVAFLPVWTRSAGPVESSTRPAASGDSRFPFDPVNPPTIEAGERRLADAPSDLVAGAALAVRLARDGRSDEARLVVGRLRQVPGGALHPLVDYAEADVALRNQEPQRQLALVLLTRAERNALAQERGDLVGTIRLARGGVLMSLGQRDKARLELEQARLDLDRAGDYRPLYRALVELAVLHGQRGELSRSEELFEAAVTAAENGGFNPTIATTNLAETKLLLGRPDLAEPLAQRSVDLARARGTLGRFPNLLGRQAEIVRELGRPEEARALLDEAHSIAGESGKVFERIDTLFRRSLVDLDEGRLDRLDDAVRELEIASEQSLDRRALAHARSVTARREWLVGNFEVARSRFAEARRIYLAAGDGDLAANSDLSWAAGELGVGDTAAAAKILDQALVGLAEPSATPYGYFTETLRVRIAASRGDLAAARRHLETLGENAASSPSLPRRIAYLRARAAVADREQRHSDARRDRSAAIELARQGRWRIEELELRIELATRHGERSADLTAIGEEAEAAGLVSIARQARLLATTANARPTPQL